MADGRCLIGSDDGPQPELPGLPTPGGRSTGTGTGGATAVANAAALAAALAFMTTLASRRADRYARSDRVGNQ